MKGRFSILQYVCHVKLENVPKIIVTSVVINNITKPSGTPNFKPHHELLEEKMKLMTRSISIMNYLYVVKQKTRRN